MRTETEKDRLRETRGRVETRLQSMNGVWYANAMNVVGERDLPPTVDGYK